MTLHFDVDAVVLDIEGTTSATGFVVDVLYPYSRSRFAALLAERGGDPAVARAIAQVRELTGEPDADAVRDREDAERLAGRGPQGDPAQDPPGHHLVGGLRPRRPRLALLRRRRTGAARLARGGPAAVRLLVRLGGGAARVVHATARRATSLPLVSGLYDTENAGPKQEPESYRRIAEATGIAPGRLLFLSDRPGELDAAARRGLARRRDTAARGAVLRARRRRPRAGGDVRRDQHHQLQGAPRDQPTSAHLDLEEAGAVLAAESARFASLRLDAGHLREPVRGALP